MNTFPRFVFGLQNFSRNAVSTLLWTSLHAESFPLYLRYVLLTIFLLHINDLLTKTDNPFYGFADNNTSIPSFSSTSSLTLKASSRWNNTQIHYIHKYLERIAKRSLVDFKATEAEYTRFCLKTRCQSNSTINGNDINWFFINSWVSVSIEVAYVEYAMSTAKKQHIYLDICLNVENDYQNNLWRSKMDSFKK